MEIPGKLLKDLTWLAYPLASCPQLSCFLPSCNMDVMPGSAAAILWPRSQEPDGNVRMAERESKGAWILGVFMTCGVCPTAYPRSARHMRAWLISAPASLVSSFVQPNTILNWYRTWKILTKSAPPSQCLNLTAWTQSERQFASFKNGHYIPKPRLLLS